MTHIFNAGFDDCNGAGDAILCGFSAENGTVAFSTDTRYGVGHSLSVSGTANTTKSFTDQAGKTVFVGFAVKMALPLTSITNISFQDSVAAAQCFLQYDSSGVLSLVRGSTVLASVALSSGVWHWLECEIVIGNAGTFKLYIDGVLSINFSGDNQNSATNSFASIKVGSGTATTTLFDDLYIANSDGTLNNALYGEVVSRLIYPNGDTVSQWTRNTGATDSAAIDDPLGTPDDDTTRIDSSVVGNKNTHAMATLTNVGTVHAVKGIIRATKTDAGARTIKHGVKSGATEQQASIGVAGSYGNSFNYWETSDGVSTQFNQATIDSIEMTIEDFA
jgi:hypothetical protein